jgi:hypothetical protein
MLVAWLAYSSTLKMEEVLSPKHCELRHGFQGEVTFRRFRDFVRNANTSTGVSEARPAIHSEHIADRSDICVCVA